ncbi:hypothetical protein [Methylocella tundrae]|uniref:hypothetical protein n=1 Tax=Methylocella tundrae TaxID=227605 RepID=UPI0030FE3A39|nr:hypothetical protein SIN04_07720 [Methylocella tundrae]
MLFESILLFGIAPDCEPGFASTPGAPAPDGVCISSAERPSCFWVAALGSTFLPAAVPDVVPLVCAIATPPKSSAAAEMPVKRRKDITFLLFLLKSISNDERMIWLLTISRRRLHCRALFQRFAGSPSGFSRGKMGKSIKELNELQKFPL